ncbi:MAG: hypothetical protein HY711_07270, partial [Candidatus Melainabacteria bacterium]|nr:hypothetical protein [Candidatus Melainabacteria bacterium]
LIEGGLARTEHALQEAKAQLKKWFETQNVPRNKDGTIAYWDAPLKYPDQLTEVERGRLTELQAKVQAATGAEKASIEAELRGLKYKGLSETEIEQYEFAKQIRSKMVELLRAQQGNHEGIQTPSRASTDVDGRPVEGGFRQRIRAEFADLTQADKLLAQQRVVAELQAVRASGGTKRSDGQPESVYDRLMSNEKLAPAQKSRVLDMLGEVREHYASLRDGSGKILPDQAVNWIHTQGELGRVLDAAVAEGLTGRQIEDALLASMFSDSAKYVATAVTKANFTTHHLDGALAAHEVMTRAGFPPEQINTVVQAILEHQVAPPGFMGMIYRNTIAGVLEQQRASGNITPEKYEQMRATLESMITMTKDYGPVITRIANVNEAPLVKDSQGYWEVAFTPQERELLQLAGIEHWHVSRDPSSDPEFHTLPAVEQERLISQYRVSKAVQNGDSIDNYATVGGASKIVKIRGPETIFRDETVWMSVESIDKSFSDALEVLSPKGKTAAQAALAERNAVLHDAHTGIRAQMEQWLQTQGDRVPRISQGPNKGKIAFYHEDAPLKYPEQLSTAERDQLTALQRRLAEPNLSSQDRAKLEAEARLLKYKGLNDEEVRQFEFAKEIRDYMVDCLRKAQRTDGQAPGDFIPVRGIGRATVPDGAAAPESAPPGESAVVPQAVRARQEVREFERLLDQAEQRLRERQPIPEQLDPVRLREVCEEIAVKFRDKPISREQFEKLFDGFTEQDRQIAYAIMERSLGNLTSRGVDAQMSKVKEQIAAWKLSQIYKPDVNSPTGFKPVDTVKVYVLDGTTDGNALAHLFKANTGIEPQIEVLSGPNLARLQFQAREMQKLQAVLDAGKAPEHVLAKVRAELAKKQQESDLHNVVIFDNLTNATEAQKAVLSSVDTLLVADVNGFSRNPNMYDLASARLTGDTAAVSEKLVPLVEMARELERAGLSREQALECVLSRDIGQMSQAARTLEQQGLSREAALKQVLEGNIGVGNAELPNAQVYRGEAAVSPRADLRAGMEGGDRKYYESSMYQELTSPLATPEQVRQFLGRLSAEHQFAAARLLRDGVEYNPYSAMMEQARQLHETILRSIPDNDPANMLIITGMEGSGSSYMVNHLYSKVNGLTEESFISISDLRMLVSQLENRKAQLTPEVQRLVERLKGKRVVYLDDYAASGRQIPNLLNQYERDIFHRLVDADGRRLIDGVLVGTLGRYESAPGRNYWTNTQMYPHIRAQADTLGRPSTATVQHELAPGGHYWMPEPSLRHVHVEMEASGAPGGPTKDSYLSIQIAPSPAGPYPDFFGPQGVLWGLKPIFENLGGTTSVYSSSSVTTALVTPYGGPNNNIPLVQAFAELPGALGLPRKYPNETWWALILGQR